MNIPVKSATTIFLIIGTLIFSSSRAVAGEGFAAGSVAVLTNAANQVTSVSTSIAVGKKSATAGGFNTATETTTFAIGGSGTLSVPTLGNNSYSISADPDLTTPQSGTLSQPQQTASTTPGVTTIIDRIP